MTDAPLLDADQSAYLDHLRAEAAQLPELERAEQELLIAELAGDIAMGESIDRAKKLVDGEGLHNATTALVDFGKIGWITEQDVSEMPAEEISAAGLDYVFVDLSGKNRVTHRLSEENEKARMAERLKERITQEKIPQLWQGVTTGRNQERSISLGTKPPKGRNADQSLNTTYAAYKVDVFGSNYRAILLFLDRTSEGKPVIGLAATYPHAYQKEVYNNLFTKPIRQRSRIRR